MLPKLAISLITYNRAATLETTIRSYLQYLQYPKHLIYWCIGDDGSTDNTQAVIAKWLPDAKVETRKRLGMAGNWNATISLAHEFADLVLCVQDDWMLTEPLDLRHAVAFLEHNPNFGMFRYHKLTGHNGLQMKMREWDTHHVLEGYNDGAGLEYVPHMMSYLELLPQCDNDAFSPYSGGIHLRHKRFTAYYGGYPERTGFSNSEILFWNNLNAKLRTDSNAPKVAIQPYYIYNRFKDISPFSYRGTEVEKETVAS